MSKFLSIIKIASKQTIKLNMVARPMNLVKFNSVKLYTTSKMISDAVKSEPFLDSKVVLERVIEVIKKFEKVNSTKVASQSKFKEDLDLDSLDAVEVVMALEEEFSIEIPDSEADKILSIPDAVAYLSNHPMAK